MEEMMRQMNAAADGDSPEAEEMKGAFLNSQLGGGICAALLWTLVLGIYLAVW